MSLSSFPPVRTAALVLGLALSPDLVRAQQVAPAGSGSPSASPSGAIAQDAGETRRSRARRDANEISDEELASATQGDVFSLVQSLRPRWLQTRGTGSIALSERVRVYIDGVPAGSVAALRTVQTRSVRSVRRLDRAAATQRYGTDHGGGVILVELR